jgi:hypothetical protein
MPGYATVTREEAQKQGVEVRPPQAAVVVPEAPKNAAPGSHPAVPVETDPEALAAYQGFERPEAENIGSWKLNAWNQPVWVPGTGAQGSSRRSATPAELALPEDREPPAEKPKAMETQRREK